MKKSRFLLLTMLLVSFLYTNINAQFIVIDPIGWSEINFPVTLAQNPNHANPNNPVSWNEQKLGYGQWRDNTPTGVLITGLLDVSKLDSIIFPVDIRFNEELAPYTNASIYALEEGTNKFSLLWVAENKGNTFPTWRTITLDLSAFSDKSVRLVFLFNGDGYADLITVDVGKLLTTADFGDGGGNADTFPEITWKTEVADTIFKGDPMPTFPPYTDYTASDEGVDITDSVNVFWLRGFNADSVGRYPVLFTAVDSLGGIAIQLVTIQVINLVGIEDINVLPEGYSLSQNYPNPFNPTTKIRFSIPSASFVTLKVYNMLGQEISTLVNEEKSLGTYEADFNASGLPSGAYVYRITAGNFVQTKKMILLK